MSDQKYLAAIAGSLWLKPQSRLVVTMRACAMLKAEYLIK
jgi:hypothetical protein